MSENRVWFFEAFDPIREDVPVEKIFVDSWHALVGGANQINEVYFLENYPEEHPFIGVINNGVIPTVGDARVATSVIRWLGTNMGRYFRQEAAALIAATVPKFMTRGEAYLAVWSRMNIQGAVHGFTTRDALLAPLKKIFEREVSVHDYEVMERIVLWLGSANGQKYLMECEAKEDVIISASRQATRLALDA